MKPLALILTILANAVAAQSSLPPCDPNVASTSWTNCQGTATYFNGDKYVGEHRDGKRNGQGTYTHANGNKYVGEFRDDKPHGQGTYTFAIGGKYVGELRDGKYNGQGTYYSLADNQFKGDKYVGEYKDNKKHGQGTYTFANGDKYVGEWRDNMRRGQGITPLPTVGPLWKGYGRTVNSFVLSASLTILPEEPLPRYHLSPRLLGRQNCPAPRCRSRSLPHNLMPMELLLSALRQMAIRPH